MGRQTDRQTDRQTYIHIDIHTHTHTHTHTDTHTHKHTHTRTHKVLGFVNASALDAYLMRRPEFVQGGYIFESRQRNATTFVVQARVHA